MLAVYGTGRGGCKLGVCGATEGRTTHSPWKKLGLVVQRGKLRISSEQGKSGWSERMEEWRGRACSRALHRGLRIAWKGKFGSGSGWALCENAGGRRRKVRGWQRGQKSLRRITLRRAGGPQRQKIENRIRSDWSRVFRASSAWDNSVSSGPATKRVKLSGGSHISISPQIRVVWIRDGWRPDQLSRPKHSQLWHHSLHSPLPQHHDKSCYAVQNEGLWKQSSWLLAQGILGFQWLKTRVQSAEASTGCWSC